MPANEPVKLNRPSPRRKTEDEELKIIELYLQGISQVEIQEILNVGKSTIIRILDRNNITRDRKKQSKQLSEEEKLKAIELYNSGKRMKDISKELSCSDYMIRELAREKGFDIRGLGGQRYKWTDEEIKDIINRWENGESQSSIAKTYNLDYKHITYVLQLNCPNYEFKKNNKTNHGGWKGGKTICTSGYILIKIYPDNPYFSMAARDGYIMEHRLNMAIHLNRPLTSNETVHHIDGNKENNDISNLQLRQGRHGKGQKFVCCECGSHNVKATDL